MAISKSEYPVHPRLAVGAIIFHEDRVLLVRRGNAPSKGQWSIPGGKVKLGETLREAAEREIQEETGICIQAGETVFTFEHIEHNEHGEVVYHYVVIDLEAEYISGKIQAADDAMDARWISAQNLERLNVNATTRNLLKKIYNFG